MFSKFDALIIGALSIGGTGAMVEAGNRVTITPPDEIAVVEVQPTVKVCAVAGPSGEFLFMHYAPRGRAVAEGLSCIEARR